MFSVAKVTDFYYMTDDFCKDFAKIQEKYVVEGELSFGNALLKRGYICWFGLICLVSSDFLSCPMPFVKVV